MQVCLFADSFKPSKRELPTPISLGFHTLADVTVVLRRAILPSKCSLAIWPIVDFPRRQAKFFPAPGSHRTIRDVAWGRRQLQMPSQRAFFCCFVCDSYFKTSVVALEKADSRSSKVPHNYYHGSRQTKLDLHYRMFTNLIQKFKCMILNLSFDFSNSMSHCKVEFNLVH